MIYQLLAAIIALMIGLKLPDIDLAPILWRHRSAWTHGPLWAIMLPMIPLPWWATFVPAAALIGVTWHLLLDAFPKAWIGSALINTAPLRLRFKSRTSFAYIMASAIFSGFTVWRMLS